MHSTASATTRPLPRRAVSSAAALLAIICPLPSLSMTTPTPPTPRASERARPSNTPLHELDAASLSHLLDARQVTAVEVMQSTLDRIDSINPSLNAIVSLRDRDELMEEARRCDEELRAGGRRRGWLHGVPVAIKDLSDAAGLPTTRGGSPLFSDAPPAAADDPFARRLRGSGAVVVGKTNAPEFGLGSHTYNPVFGPTRNPYDGGRSAGGSSGGAAAALASGLVCVADGSDMMGSLRNPAGWNGIYSHRPSAGMVEEADAGDAGGAGEDDAPAAAAAAAIGPLPYPISAVGPMARTPADCARLLETIVGGPDLFDASAALLPPRSSSDPSAAGEEEPLRGKRVGWLGDWDGAYPMEDGILDTCKEALSLLEAAGAVVAEVGEAPFPARELWSSWTTIRSHVICTKLVDEFGADFLSRHGSEIKPELRWEFVRGIALAPAEVDEAVAKAASWSLRASELFGTYDALALPSAQLWPFPVEWDWPKVIAGKEMDTYHRWMEVVVPVSLGGLPCVTVPAGIGVASGLPIGLQLFGERGRDAELLSMACAYHAVRSDRAPPRKPLC